MTNSRARLAALALGGLGVGVCALLSLPAQAVNTRSFSLDSAADLVGGELDRVAVIDDGSVVLGVDTERMAPPDQVGSVWSMLDLGDGSVLCATGPEGKLFAVDPSAAGNNATVLFDAEQEHLTAMTLGPENEVVLGSSGGAAVLYGVRGPGRARVIARLTGDEVKGVVVAGDSQSRAPTPRQRTAPQRAGRFASSTRLVHVAPAGRAVSTR